MADPAIVTCLSLFSGIGGLDRGVADALGGRVRHMGYVEREAFAAAVLLARMEGAALEPAPIWCGDLADMDLAPFVGVDLITAGAPCQPYSVAGKREGEADERYLWPAIFRVIETCRPSLVFLENVPGLLAWFRPIGEELCRLGFELEACLIRASDIGAPHRRERVFILAWRVSDSGRDAIRLLAERGPGAAQAADERNAQPGDVGLAALADRGDDGHQLLREAHDHDGGDAPGDEPHGCDPGVGDTERDRLGIRGGPASEKPDEGHAGVGDAGSPERRADPLGRGRSSEGRDREGQGPGGPREPDPRLEHARGPGLEGRGLRARGWAFPPGPGDAEGWRRWIAQGGPEPALRRGPDGLPSRVDQLRSLGNAVVPAQAAAAFRELIRRG